MHCIQSITADICYVGASDRRLSLFENVYPIPRGVSYNSYLVLDEKTVLLDTVDKAVGDRFWENVEYGLQGRPLDYVVVNHMEPDHCALLMETLRRWPEVQVVGSAKTVSMISQFFDLDVSGHCVTVKEGDTLQTGRHTFTFLMAPMVHWPEVMVTYDVTEKILFSADAFGTFGALNGNLFADEVQFERDWLDDARRYYTNIVGKYGVQVQSLLKKAAQQEIAMLQKKIDTMQKRQAELTKLFKRCLLYTSCFAPSAASWRRTAGRSCGGPGAQCHRSILAYGRWW